MEIKQSYLFDSREETEKMVNGAYLKLKSYLYHDKTLMFAKCRLAVFESNREQFEKALEDLAQALCEKKSEYFHQFLHEINYRVLPKKFKDTPQIEKSDIIRGNVNHKREVDSINFFIDLPVELQILDFLWTLLVGKISQRKEDFLSHATATKFKKSLFNDNEDLFSGIDFDSNRAFELYYNLYRQWRSGAFETIKSEISHADTVLLCLDLRRFYYSVELNFQKISEYLNHDERLKQFDFLTRIIEQIYSIYTQKLSKIFLEIKNPKERFVLPIGLASSIVLRELYLYDIDRLIMENLCPAYYQRYVDDILLVLSDVQETQKMDDLIRTTLVEKDIIEYDGETTMSLKRHKNLKIQTSKINCFFFHKGEKPILLDKYEQILQMNSSEYNLLPDIDILDAPFELSAYKIDNLDGSSKIRELGFLKNDSYMAMRYIGSLSRLVKNTYVNEDVLDPCLVQIEEFYKGSQCVEFSNHWRSLFELLLACGQNSEVQNSRARQMYRNIKDEISDLRLTNELISELKSEILENICNQMQQDLTEKLKISAALAVSLNLYYASAENDISKEVRELAENFRKSNLLNHTLVTFPLLNYSKNSKWNLTNINLYELLQEGVETFHIDDFKMKWSPRFINFLELQMQNFIVNVEKKSNEHLDDIYKYYCKVNHLKQYKAFFECEDSTNKGIVFEKISVKNSTCINPKIALANTKVNKDMIFQPLIEKNDNLNIEMKTKLYKIINTAKKEKVDILVFPEFYFPIEWVMDVAMFAIKNNLTIITGMRYIPVNRKAYNEIFHIIPTTNDSSFKSGILRYREKNFYAPEERTELAKMGYRSSEDKKPKYYIIENKKFSYSSVLCYEFTDIISRAAMKSKIEILFVPQLNRDTNYFSAIVESTARDLHCFVVQANTSEYGDSRITAPYKTLYKNILQIKGGETDTVMIAELDISKLTKKRKAYQEELEAKIEENLKVYENSLQEKSIEGEDSGEKIKGVPPNFKSK